MAIAFKTPFTAETQALRDAVNMSDSDAEEVPCGQCDVAYVLLYPKSSSQEQRLQYRAAAQQGMANCNHHPAWIELPF